MGLYLKLKDLNLFNILIKLNNLLDNGFVINHIYLKNSLMELDNIKLLENKNIDKKYISLKAQFFKNNDNSYTFKTFNFYNQQISLQTFENKLLFKKFILKVFSSKLKNFNKKNKYINYQNTDFFSYHKQKISKKISSNNFVSNEYDIKIEVFKFLYHKNKSAIIIPELSFDNRRVDFISFDENKINTTMIEIKSSLDNFDRLNGQLETYSKIGNYIYLALDKNKYNELIKKGIKLENHVGILIFDNDKKQKLKLLKQAKLINKNNHLIYQKYLSYNDYLIGFKGFKNNSKISKSKKEDILLNKINKEISNKFAYDVLKNRHIKESDLRKSYFENNNFEKSILSAKKLKINRFDTSGKYEISLLNYINNKNIFLNI